MTMLDERKLNGHGAEPAVRAWNDHFERLERRVAEIPDIVDQRVVALRDDTVDFVREELEPRDVEIRELKATVANLRKQLEQKTAVDRQVAEIAARLAGEQAARDEGKRGRTGKQGERGARGERGERGPRGPAGKPAKPTIVRFMVDAERYRLVPFMDNGEPGAEISLRPLFEKFYEEVSS